ncbi:hypothetical protein N059_02886, partial [Mycobacterium tuberculosis variant africanum MAL010102]
PREGTETFSTTIIRRLSSACRQTQNPERGRKLLTMRLPRALFQPSSDPKPREGTETSTPSVPHTGPVPCRQTQNPERGRKLGEPISDHRTLSVVRPKTPRGDGNFITPDQIGIGVFKSSDPKPREGTETRHRHDGGAALDAVVRPKTPRGDGNLCEVTSPTPSKRLSSDPKPREGTETRMVGKLALGSESSRQTQNPERGRKPASGKSVRSKRFQRVVRPKTPRGDGNSKSSTTSAAAACSRSRQTQNPERGRKREEPSHLGLPPAGRQTQNPERGRKLNNTFFERGAVESVVRPKTPRGDGNARNRPTWACPQRVVRPKTPRGDGNILSANSSTVPLSGRQTQNPERGRKPDDEQRHTEPRIRQVVRPKTPRGDGNPTTSSGIQSHGYARSSDPKPREGTETPSDAGTEVDDKPSSDPKPREGTETGNCVTARLAGRLSSDPKPREGTETSSTIIAIPSPHVSSDPKPREGTETSTPSVPHTGPVPCRQTQNPERGRKPSWWDMDERDYRGRQTQNPERGRKPSWWDMDERDYRGRQTQNPE